MGNKQDKNVLSHQAFQQSPGDQKELYWMNFWSAAFVEWETQKPGWKSGKMNGNGSSRRFGMVTQVRSQVSSIFSLQQVRSWFQWDNQLAPLPLTLEKYQVSSVTQSSSTLYNPMSCSTLGLPVHHQLPESTQTHVHWVGDAIQPSHPLSSPFPPALNLSQHQDLFQWLRSLHQVAKVLGVSASTSVLPMNT